MDAGFQERVLQLAAEGRITAEEGERLLLAKAPGRFPRCLWNPFDTLSPRILRFLAAGALGGSFLAVLCGARFDGTLDLHFQAHGLGWNMVPTVLEFGAVPVLSVGVLWALALLMARGTRFRDLFVNFLVARLPMLILAVALLAFFREACLDPFRHQRALLAIGLTSLPFLAWNLVLVCLGIRNATGLKGPRLGLLAGAGLLGAELATKFLLAFLP